MTSAGDAFAECVRYLEQNCYQGKSGPYPPAPYIYALVLWTFCECAKATRILEIGIGPESCSGVTFVHFLGQSSNTSLVSIDIDRNLPQPQYRELAARKGVTWLQSYGDSLDETVQPPLNYQCDVLYIDGNHDAAHAEGDLRKYLPCLRAGGYVLIDDFTQRPGIGEGRIGLDSQVPWFLHLAHDPPDRNGRLVFQKPLV